jgi:hypothetical protein
MKSAVKPKKYVTARSGQKIGVVLRIKDYKKLLAVIEELESIRAYGAARLKNSCGQLPPDLRNR